MEIKSKFKNMDTFKKEFENFLDLEDSFPRTLIYDSVGKVARHIYDNPWEKPNRKGLPYFIVHYREFLTNTLANYDYDIIHIKLLEYMYITAYDRYLKNSEIKNTFISTIDDWKETENQKLLIFTTRLKIFLDFYLNEEQKNRRIMRNKTYIQWTGKNKKEVEDFVGQEVHTFANDEINLQLHIGSAKGFDVSQGDYIIRGIGGKFYSCSQEDFHKEVNIQEKL